MSSTVHRPRLARTYRKPSPREPDEAAAGRIATSWSPRIIRSAAATAPYDAALRRKHAAGPPVARTNPPIAGPIARAPPVTAVPSAVALATSDTSHSCLVKA